ncbi:hypothetical protein KIN20_019736 [Parelaphostrongylus tenuis]|uniref:Uncharacterized protein n=1 Tax=Parelaphostrongylus tenuis TaxID=148309 RepID=A0AAD5QV80_PARTN|nr:hypothetical protein KIN20_019736 [Parelaphostrongylus tenuis]
MKFGSDNALNDVDKKPEQSVLNLQVENLTQVGLNNLEFLVNIVDILTQNEVQRYLMMPNEPQMLVNSETQYQRASVMCRGKNQIGNLHSDNWHH